GDSVCARAPRVALEGAAGSMTDYVSGAPRTTAAEGPIAVREAVRARIGPPAAWWGMVILIASEAMLFAAFVATYYYLRFTSAAWPQGGVDPPKVVVPLILVACLVATVVPMRAAWLAARAGRVAAARLFVLCALVVQCG